MNSHSYNILVIDDEPDLREIISIFLGEQLKATFTECSSANDAINKIESGYNPDIIVSDFNMPNGNGLVIYKYAKNKWPNLPFVLVTSDSLSDHPEFMNNQTTGYVQKPFFNDSIFKAVECCLKNAAPIESALLEPTYIPISLNTLLKINQINCPLYLKINETKYIKMINEFSTFGQMEYDRLTNKGASELYAEKDHFHELTKEFKNKVASNMVYTTTFAKKSEALKLSTSAQELISNAVKTFTWDNETIALAAKNIELVKSHVDNIKELSEILDWENLDNKDYTLTHSVLLTYVCAALVKKYNFKISHASEALSFASFFHDLALNDQQVRNELRFIHGLSLHLTTNKTDMNAIKDHPEQSKDLFNKWPACPQEVLRVIIEHHERPDGSGFPNKLNNDEISELSKCFIVAHDVVDAFFEHKDKASIKEDLAKKSKQYNYQTFNELYNIAINCLA